MHEDLLGYLLGALEPDEMQRVSQWLREDPEAREQLAELERLFRPLEEGYVPVEPPPSDLVVSNARQCCRQVPSCRPDPAVRRCHPSSASSGRLVAGRRR